jgi:chromosome partitioning protein
MRRIAILGFKGGIGKTTTCVNLGAALAQQGQRVLLVDSDAQANVSTALGVTETENTLAEVLGRQVGAEDCVTPVRENLYLLPGSLDLFKTQQRMVLEIAREELLKQLFSGLYGYDYVLLDCAPSMSLLTINVWTYADEAILPISMEALAVAGTTQFLQYLEETSRLLGRGASVRLVVPTFYDSRRRVSQQVLESLGTEFGSMVTHPIRIDTKLSEAPGGGQTIFEYAPDCRGAADYAQLAELVEAMPPLLSN